MATRDLTRKFVDYRTTAKIIGRNSLSPLSYAQDSSLLEDASLNGGWQSARLQLPPVWVDLVDKIDGLTAKIDVKMKELAELHRKRLMVGFDDLEATRERDIEYMTSEITSFFREAEAILKRLPREGEANGMEKMVTKNIQKAMAKRIQAQSMTFRKSQKEYLTQLKAQKEGGPMFDFLSNDNALLEAEKKYRDDGQSFTVDQLQELEQSEAMVAERDVEIQQIAKSIEELSQIFKELAVLVIDQGTILDRIDFNMEQVVEHTKEGVQQLIRAEEDQRSASPTRCIIGLIVAIFFLIVVMIIKHS